MFSKVMCCLGLHDWHVNRRKCQREIQVEVVEELDPCDVDESRLYSYTYKSYRDRVCLRCGRADNPIGRYKAKYMGRMLKVLDLGGVLIPEKRRRPLPPPAPPKIKQR